jgi:hypothetical protein
MPATIRTPATPEHFDYRSTASAAGLTDQQLQAIVRIFEVDYPSDLMLRELHVLRACNAIRSGRATVSEILGPDPAGPSAAWL